MYRNALMGLRSKKGDPMFIVALSQEDGGIWVKVTARHTDVFLPASDARHLASCLAQCADEIDPPIGQGIEPDESARVPTA